MIRCAGCGWDTDARETEYFLPYYLIPDEEEKCKRCYKEATGLLAADVELCRK